MKINEQWILAAMEVLPQQLSGTNCIVDEKGTYAREYKGYISSFGAACIQSGLLPAVIFYENSEGSKSDRELLIKAMVVMLKKLQPELYGSIRLEEKFSGFIQAHISQRTIIQAHISKAAVALKLALRTYKEREETK